MLNTQLPLTDLADRYRVDRRVQVDCFLAHDAAMSIADGLDDLGRRGLWYQAVHGSPWDMDPELAGRTAARRHFTYRFEKYPICNHPLRAMIGVRGDARRRSYDEAAKVPERPERELPKRHPLRRFGKFYTGESMGGFLSALTGHNLDASSAECFASRYGPGDYNGTHDDNTSGRTVAFVLSLTRQWFLHWGGQTAILDADFERIESVVEPAFNRLFVFDVPLPHAVLPVSPYCQGPRLALTGWFGERGGAQPDGPVS